jgi:KipI family sensor histidine kinase inhibitor
MTIATLGDGALLVRLGDTIDPTLIAQVGALAQRVHRARIAGVTEVVAAYASLALFFDVRQTDQARVADAVAPLLDDLANVEGDGRSRPVHRIPVSYDGPDLADVARLTGMTATDVVERHAGREYVVYFLGFVPGFAYLGALDPALVLPRRAEPRRRVAAGAVAIAGAQTAVYPLDTPGGWHLIGRTSTVMFDPSADPPARLAPGDRVRFVPQGRVPE